MMYAGGASTRMATRSRGRGGPSMARTRCAMPTKEISMPIMKGCAMPTSLKTGSSALEMKAAPTRKKMMKKKSCGE